MERPIKQGKDGRAGSGSDTQRGAGSRGRAAGIRQQQRSSLHQPPQPAQHHPPACDHCLQRGRKADQPSSGPASTLTGRPAGGSPAARWRRAAMPTMERAEGYVRGPSSRPKASRDLPAHPEAVGFQAPAPFGAPALATGRALDRRPHQAADRQVAGGISVRQHPWPSAHGALNWAPPLARRRTCRSSRRGGMGLGWTRHWG